MTRHFHVLARDGVYPGPSRDLGSFVPLPPPETDDVAHVFAGTARHILRVVERGSVGPNEDSLVQNEPLLASLAAATIRSQIAALVHE